MDMYYDHCYAWDMLATASNIVRYMNFIMNGKSWMKNIDGWQILYTAITDNVYSI